LPIPGAVDAPALGARYTAAVESSPIGDTTLPVATVRAWQPGDRVELAHSRGAKKVKEVLERMSIRGAERVLWPVVVWQGKIVWMRGVELAAPASADLGPRLTIHETRG
jgi:tRNA(Ile)-lysidine synthase